ncbi:MAG: hypothetical protein RTU30_12840 [Candidatus Thorarchaeota archaeon]
MITKRQLSGVFLIAILMPLFIVTPTMSVIHSSDPISSLVLSEEQLVIDPELNNGPPINVAGSSGEFEGSHHPSTAGNSVDLTWTHTNGTELDFLESPDSNLPDCADFIYTQFDCEWPLELMPIEAVISIDYSFTLTGSFDTEVYGPTMFRVYYWLIDSSDTWLKISQSYPPYSEGVQEYRIDIDYLNLVDLFEGMIEDESGTQEDPADLFTVAIGLAPTSNFQSFIGTDPWMDYDGSVTLTITKVMLNTLVDLPDDPSTILEPILNVTLDSEHETRCSGISVADDGSIFTVGSISNFSLNMGNLLLVKWSSDGELQWMRTWNTSLWSRGHGIGVKENSVYTVGATWEEYSERELAVIKWDMNGNIVWSKTWAPDGPTEGRVVSIDNEDSIYVGGSDSTVRISEHWNASGGPFYEPYWMEVPTLVKFSSEGSFLWNRTTNPYGFIYGFVQDLAIVNETIYVLDELNISTFDLDGNKLWSSWNFIHGNYYEFEMLPSGSFYRTDAYWDTYSVIRYNSTNGIEWSNTINFTENHNWFIDMQIGPSAADSRGSLYGALSRMHYTGDSVFYTTKLFKFNSSGYQDWNKTIDLRSFSFGFDGLSDMMQVTDNGVLYLAGMRIDTPNWAMSFLAYQVDEPIVQPPPSDDLGWFIPLALYGTSTVLVVAVIFDFVRRRRLTEPVS